MNTKSAIFAALLASSGPTYASTILFSNLDSPTTTNISVSQIFYYAQSFTTGSTASVLDSVTLGLTANDGSAAPFLVQVFEGLSPGLGGLVATLNGPSNPGTGNIRFTTTGIIALNPDSTYWVSARAATGYNIEAFYGWRIADAPPSIGSSAGRNMYYADQGQWVGANGPGDLLMQVDIIPEADTFILVSMSGLFFVASRRRRQSRIRTSRG